MVSHWELKVGVVLRFSNPSPWSSAKEKGIESLAVWLIPIINLFLTLIFTLFSSHSDDDATRAALEQTSLVFMWGSGVTSPIPLELPKTDHIINSVSAGKTKKLGLTSYGRVVTWEVSNKK